MTLILKFGSYASLLIAATVLTHGLKLRNLLLSALFLGLSSMFFYHRVILDRSILTMPNVMYFNSVFTLLFISIIYFNYRIMFDPDFRLKPKHLVGLIPAFLSLVLLLPKILSPASVKIEAYTQLLDSFSTIPFSGMRMIVAAPGVISLIGLFWLVYRLNLLKMSTESFKEFRGPTFILGILILNFVINIIGGLLGNWGIVKIGSSMSVVIVVGSYLYSEKYPNFLSRFVEKMKTERYAVSRLNTVMKNHLRTQLEQQLNAIESLDPSALTLPGLAAVIKVKSHQLSEFINVEYGLNFNQLINRRRIERAKELLSGDQTLAVTSIGFRVGFGSESSFHRAFKAETGMTPLQFKNDLRTSR